jgi:hypothetical protein
VNLGRVVVLDLETTGLEPAQGHEPWEYGLIVRDPGQPNTEHLWRTMPDLSKADPEALAKNRFHEHAQKMHATWSPGLTFDLAVTEEPPPWGWSDPGTLARQIAGIIDGAAVVGANPGFDVERFLRPWLARHGEAYTAHYRPLCVTAMGYAWLCARGLAGGLSWPLNSNEVSQRLGVDPGGYDRHTALGDCRWAAAQLDVVTSCPLPSADSEVGALPAGTADAIARHLLRDPRDMSAWTAADVIGVIKRLEGSRA